MVEEKKQQVHVCPICNEGHINDQEYMKICPKCFREHEIDLAFVQWSIEKQKVIESTLDEHAKKFDEQVKATTEKYIEKSKRFSRRSMLIFKIYIIAAMYWLGVTIGQAIF